MTSFSTLPNPEHIRLLANYAQQQRAERIENARKSINHQLDSIAKGKKGDLDEKPHSQYGLKLDTPREEIWNLIKDYTKAKKAPPNFCEEKVGHVAIEEAKYILRSNSWKDELPQPPQYPHSSLSIEKPKHDVMIALNQICASQIISTAYTISNSKWDERAKMTEDFPTIYQGNPNNTVGYPGSEAIQQHITYKDGKLLVPTDLLQAMQEQLQGKSRAKV